MSWGYIYNILHTKHTHALDRVSFVYPTQRAHLFVVSKLVDTNIKSMSQLDIQTTPSTQPNPAPLTLGVYIRGAQYPKSCATVKKKKKKYICRIYCINNGE